jgi:hypothetical protein
VQMSEDEGAQGTKELKLFSAEGSVRTLVL